MAITWEGILTVEGQLTSRGDDRFINPGAANWTDDLPIPFRFVRSDVGRHDNAVTVGTIDEIWRDGNFIKARGTYDHRSPEGLEAARLAYSKIQPGISIDPDDVVAQMAIRRGDGSFLSADEMHSLTQDDITPDMKPVDVWVTARIRSATQVAIPAFADAKVTSVDLGEFAELFDDPSAITAAAMSHDGAMVALVPSEADQSRLAADGYEPAEVLHLTLAYLGPADQYSPEDRDAIEAALSGATVNLPSNTAEAWASAHFNPTSNDKDPAAVYLIGAPGLTDVRNDVIETIEPVISNETSGTFPEQHDPFIPHVTVGYGLDPAELSDFGPVAFDRLRLSFGSDDVRDIPLSGDPAGSEPEPALDDEADELAARVLSGGWCAPSSVGELDELADIRNARVVNTPGNVTASAIPPHTTPVSALSSEWDGDVAEKSLPTGEEPEFYARFYAYQSDKGDGSAKDHWHYIHHHVEGSGSDAEVGDANVVACRAIIQLLNGARGVDVVAKGQDRQTVYDHVAKHMRDGGYDDVPDLIQNTTSSAAPTQESPMPTSDCTPVDNLIASAIDIPTVPAAHFTPFDLIEPTPLTITSDGHVFGHIAPESVCHVGMPGCVTMPRSATSLKYFHTGVVRLDDGSDLPTGRITMRSTHADIKLDWRRAMAHYDDVATCIADVVAVEDDHGIAVFGHIRPGTTPEMIHAFRASTPSGDWRRIGNSAELINVHMVNSPGFPVYRVTEGRHEASIVASAFGVRTAASVDEWKQEFGVDSVTLNNSDLDYDVLAERVAERLAAETEASTLHAQIAPDIDAAVEDLHARVTDPLS